MSNMIYVYFDMNGLPYKDKELTVHFPVVGNSFQHASYTTKIRFYVDRLLNDDTTEWLACAKLPNGQIGYTRLEQGSDDNGTFVQLALTKWHTQFKGDLFINLQGYDGGVEFEENEDEVLVPVGAPVVYVSGTIKLSINYSTGLITGDEYITPETLQELLAYLSKFLKVDSAKYFKVIDAIANINTSANVEINEETGTRFINIGDIVYAKNEKCLYQIVGENEYPNLEYEDIKLELPELLVQSLEVGTSLKVNSFNDIVDNNNQTLQEALEDKQDTIPVVVLTTLSGTINPPYLQGLALFPSYLTYEYSGAKSVFEHCSTDSNYFYFRKLFKESVHDNTQYLIYGGDVYIQVNKTTGVYSQQSVQYTFYSKAKTDELLGGKQNVIDSSHKLASDLVDDTNQTNKFVTSTEKTYWNSKANRTYVDNSFAHSIDLTIDSNYDLVVKLLDAGGHVLSQDDVDLPLESIVVSATYYDSYTYGGTTYSKVIVIVLATTSVPTIVPVGDLVSGLATTTELTNGLATKQNVIDSSHKLSADLVENGDTNKVFTATEQTKLSGIEVNAQVNVLEGVQLNGTDLTIANKKVNITGLQDTLVSGTNIKTINGESVLGSGNLEVTVDLDDYAKVDGNYPTMTVGSADNLTPYGENSGANDTTPFVFQSTGGNSDVGIKAYLKALRGNSVSFGQLVQNGNFANGTANWSCQNGSISASSNILTYTITTVKNDIAGNRIDQNFTHIVGHKYLFKFSVKCPHTTPIRIYLNGFQLLGNASADVWTDFAVILTNTNINNYANNMIYFECKESNGYVVNDTIQIKNCSKYDLTQMFGAGNEPTSVLEFNRLFPKPYYPYNAGTLLSCKVNGIKNVWYNEFDNSNPNDFIRVVSGQTYTLDGNGTVALYDYNQTLLSDTFTSGVALPNNCCYVKITGGSTDTCFHLTWDGSRTGYEPYETKTYALPNVELRSAGSVYDELKPDGTLIRRVGSYTFTGNENIQLWQTNTGQTAFYWVAQSTLGFLNSTQNFICDKLQKANYNNIKTGSLGIGISGNNLAFGLSTSQLPTQTVDAFKTWLANNQTTIYFELATPTETQDDNYQYQEIQDIDDFGTQEFLYDSNIAIPVPQGNEFFYPVDYKAFIDSLGGREDIEYSADKIVSQTQLANYLKTISGYDATKTQTLKNVNGTFTWVDD